MNEHDLESLSYRELYEIHTKCWSSQTRVPLDAPIEKTFDALAKNADLKRTMQRIGELVARRAEAGGAKTLAEGAKAEHERRYAAEPIYRAQVDAAFHEWARLEAVEAMQESILAASEKPADALRLEIRKKQDALLEECESRLVALAAEIQSNLDNATLPFDERLEILKRELASRSPPLKGEYKARIRVLQFEYKENFAELYEKTRHAAEAASAARWASLAGRKAYSAAIGDCSNLFTPRTTKEKR